jgi:nucleotide-binding universal stress UspA family protein
MVNNILVAIDGSETSIRGLEMAIELAKRFSAKLHLLP